MKNWGDGALRFAAFVTVIVKLLPAAGALVKMGVHWLSGEAMFVLVRR
jgi:hypothetical protein